LSIRLPIIDSLASQVSDALTYLGMGQLAMKITACYGFKQCGSLFCPRCLCRTAARERKHLRAVLSGLLTRYPKYEMYMVTGATKNSQDVATHARAAVEGMRCLLKHPALKNRIVESFGCLELANKYGPDPCSHAHALIVTRPLTGNYYISQLKWNAMWAECCPLAREPGERIRRRTTASEQRQKNLPCLAEPIKRGEWLHGGVAQSFDQHVLAKIRYVTKWAGPGRIAEDFYVAMSDLEQFATDRRGLQGIPRFWGSLSRGRKSKADAQASIALILSPA
jgi:Replication protein